MSEKLLPCPFCGEQATYKTQELGGTVYCNHLSYCPLDGNEKLSASVNEWNTRQAPAGVVLPEREELERERTQPNSWDDYTMGWNACLDEVKRLNNIKEKPKDPDAWDDIDTYGGSA